MSDDWNYRGYGGKHPYKCDEPKCWSVEAICWGIALAFAAVAVAVLAIVVFT